MHRRQKDQHNSQIELGKLHPQYQQQYAPMEAAARKTLGEWWVAADENFLSAMSIEPDTPQAAQLSIGAGSETPAEWQLEVAVVQQHVQA
jgi:hypothetical protein